MVLLASPGARAQIESREGIALQNQMLELRREMTSCAAVAPASPRPPPRHAARAAAS